MEKLVKYFFFSNNKLITIGIKKSSKQVEDTEMLGDDLEYTDDRVEHKQPTPVKKNITLKLKSANIASSTSSTPVNQLSTSNNSFIYSQQSNISSLMTGDEPLRQSHVGKSSQIIHQQQQKIGNFTTFSFLEN